MRLILTIVILSIASISIAFGQSNNTTSTQASEENKTGQTETSSNYYINERGLAVYRKNPINAPKTISTNTDSNRTEPVVKKEVTVDSNTNIKASVNPTTATNDSQVEKRVSSSFFLKKDPRPIESFSAPRETVIVDKVEDTEVSNKEDKPVVRNIISVLGSGTTNKTEVEQLDEIDEEEEVIVKKPTSNKKKSVFDRKRESQYKTLEEAALAVEALLEDLKKDQQAQSNSAGSMSARLSRGANKSLRRDGSASVSKSSNPKPTTVSSTSTSKSSSPKKEDDSTNTLNDEFDNLPSYFINGQQVEKTEVDRLRKKDIISKEVRVRNTVTGNPNGEVWYEVK